MPNKNIQPIVIRPSKPLKVIAWIPFWDQVAAYQSYIDHKELLDAIGFFWYYLKPDGMIQPYKNAKIDPAILKEAKISNVKTMMVLTNMPDYTERNTDWDWRRVDRVISTEESRKRHVAEIVSIVLENGFDGLDLDYEALQANQRDNFSAFIRLLSQKLHENQKLLGVAIHPKTSENNPNEDNGSHAQDWQSIANDADILYFMTYTEKYKGSLPGSSGSLPWINQVIRYAVDSLSISPQKIYLGIGLFGLEWVDLGNNRYRGIEDDLTYNQIQSIISSSGVQPIWDNVIKSYKLEYVRKEAKHIIWYNDAQSVKALVVLAKAYSLGGIAFWRLGGEDENIWQQKAWRR